MMRRPRGGRRTITGTWRTILFTVIGVVALAAGLVALASWELKRKCVRRSHAGGYRVCAECR
jgi:hypothetical protein